MEKKIVLLLLIMITISGCTGSTPVKCDQKEPGNYLCFYQGAVKNNDASLCDKAGAFRDTCLAKVKGMPYCEISPATAAGNVPFGINYTITLSRPVSTGVQNVWIFCDNQTGNNFRNSVVVADEKSNIRTVSADCTYFSAKPGLYEVVFTGDSLSCGGYVKVE